MTEQQTRPDLPDPSLRSVGELLGDITADLSTLMRQEMDLAKAELRETADHAKAGGAMFGGAAVSGQLALLFLSLALWWALGDLIGLGWSALVVGLLWAVVAGALAAAGRARLRQMTPVAQRTIDTTKDIPDALRGHETRMSSNDPDTIRREIDQTRGRLSEDVDVLAESVRPSSVAKRTANRATSRVSRVKDSVMGTAHDVTETGSDQAHEAAQAVRAAPDLARRQTRGNPLAAGAIALAAGWLVGSLIPASEKERELATGGQGAGAAGSRRGEVARPGDRGAPQGTGPAGGGVGQGHRSRGCAARQGRRNGSRPGRQGHREQLGTRRAGHVAHSLIGGPAPPPHDGER